MSEWNKLVDLIFQTPPSCPRCGFKEPKGKACGGFNDEFGVFCVLNRHSETHIAFLDDQTIEWPLNDTELMDYEASQND